MDEVKNNFFTFNTVFSDIRPRAFLNVGVEIRGGEMAPKVIDLRNNGINIVLADWVDSLGGDRNFCSTHVCPEPFQLLLKSNPIYCDCNMQVCRFVRISDSKAFIR